MSNTKRRTITLTGGALALASIGFAAVKAGKKGAQVHIEEEFPVPAHRVIDLIKQVERETEFVPFVSRVDVLEREDNAVRYRVNASLPVPWWALYRKYWDYERRWVAWKSEDGSYGLSHRGEIIFEDTPAGCTAKLTTDYRFSVALVGGAATLGSEPVIKAAMSGWLRNLKKAFLESEEI